VPDLLRKNFPISGKNGDAKARPAINQSSTSGWASTASNLSHELRTPLASMKSSLSLVLAEDAGPLVAEQTHFLNMVMRNVNRLERLIDNRLGAARAEVTEPLPQVDLAPVMTEVIAMQTTAADKAGVQLLAAAMPASLPAQIDPDKLVQILANVIGNAIKYTPREGVVRVWLDQGLLADPGLAGQLAREFNLAWGTFRITIQDTGVGLSSAACARVFEPWYRANNDVPGSGLGLPITNSLVAEYGGHIRLDSALGHGTTVRIDLPTDHQSSVLMRAANSIQEMVSDGRTQSIAVLDARDGNPGQVGAVMSEYVASHTDHEVVTLAPGLFATVVPTSTAWSRLWEKDWLTLLQDRRCTSRPIWRLLAWHGYQNKQSSISSSTDRNLS